MVTRAVQTRDGLWRVEVTQVGQQAWCRILRAGRIYGQLDVATTERVLARAGVDLVDLEPVEV